MLLINSIKAICFYLTIVVCGWTGLLFAMTPAVPLIFFNRRLYFRWCSNVQGYFLLMITCLLEDLFGIRFIVTGDNLYQDKKRSIIILNHRTRMDWLYSFMLYSRYQTLEQLKIVLKAQLKSIPGLGWALQHAAYLFLERHWEEDKPRITSLIEYYKTSQSPNSLLLFPEGTNLSQKTQDKSNAYAAKQTTFNRPYEFCLHPRTTGFTYLLNIMRSNEIIDAVDDVTIGYEGKFAENELDLLKGYIPKAVHCHVKRYNINEIPQDDEDIANWLKTIWDEKENRLKKFYTEYKFDGLPIEFCNSNKQLGSIVRRQRRLALLFWILYSLFWFICFLMFIKIKFYVILVCLFHLVMEVFAHGIIDFVCQLNGNKREQRSAIKNQ